MRLLNCWKPNALATANNNSLHTTLKEEPQGNSEAQSVIPNITQTDSETEQVDFVKHEENNMQPNKKPRLNMDWFDDVVLVATEGPKFTKAEIVANEVKRYVSEPLSTVDPLTWWRESSCNNVASVTNLCLGRVTTRSHSSQWSKKKVAVET